MTIKDLTVDEFKLWDAFMLANCTAAVETEDIDDEMCLADHLIKSRRERGSSLPAAYLEHAGRGGDAAQKVMNIALRAKRGALLHAMGAASNLVCHSNPLERGVAFLSRDEVLQVFKDAIAELGSVDLGFEETST